MTFEEGSLTGVVLLGSAAIATVPATAVGISAGVIANDQPVSSFQSDTTLSTLEVAVPATTFAGDWTAGETGEQLGPIRLPAGQVYEAPAKFPAADRGFGRESLLQLPGATEDTVVEGIGDVLRAPSAVEQDGPYTIVIGDENPFGAGKIAIRLLTTRDVTIVVNAQPYDVLDDPTGRSVIIDYGDEHPLDGPNHPNSYSEIIPAINNPDEIWQRKAADRDISADRFYIKKTNNGYLVVRTRCTTNPTKIIGFTGYGCTVGTAVYYNTLQEARNSFDNVFKVYP